ncbi:zinc ribbon domain-containing protein [Halococcus sediminicola]|uniref:zinc ribbon domain-containing protein n=1 Tax=Halococcus sediminicola TaxID=1264579 RepID=UPI00067995E3|nr:zinc ribbon domain-containing protein [Halococcus sediminicola]
MRGIDDAAVYLPRYRLAGEEVEAAWGRSPHSETVVPGADEDAFTMAVAAAGRLFEQADSEREAVEHVALASTTPPLEEGLFAPRLGRALGLGNETETSEYTQSTLAGAEALSRALDASGPALVVVTDCPASDPADGWGAGAVALLVTDDAAVVVPERAWYTDEYPGLRYRERGSETVESIGVTTYERTATRECVAGAAAQLDGIESVAHATLHQPDGRMPGRIAGDLPLDGGAIERGTVVDRVGDAGAATVFLGLTRVLATAATDDRTLVGAFGSGGAGAAFVFEGTLPVAGLDGGDLPDGERISYAHALRKRGVLDEEEVAGGGARVSLPTWRESLDQRYHLRAGRCPDCGNVQFPPEGACSDCGSRADFEPHDLPQVGTVRARTVVGQGGAPPEFATQQRRDGAYGVVVVGFEGTDVTLPAQLTDCDPERVQIGDSVRAVVRRIYEQEGIGRYGVKFVPAE